jgi:hypothetical protein
VHSKGWVAAAYLEAPADWYRAQRAIDQQVRAAVESEVFKVDSHVP